MSELEKRLQDEHDCQLRRMGEEDSLERAQLAGDALRELQSLRSQVEGLREYARHAQGCNAEYSSDYKCTCGYAALKGTKGEL